jgi:transcriptional regulator with XRE-family HTH domain
MDETHTTKNAQPENLGDYIRQQREVLGISQRQLATRAKIHHSKIARLENGYTGGRPNPEHLQRIANALGVDVTKLLRYLGVTPRPELPSVRTYFRRKLGVNADQADVLAGLVADYQRNYQEPQKKGGTYESTNQPRD